MILKRNLEEWKVREKGKRTSFSARSSSMPAGRDGHSSAYAVLKHLLISADARLCRAWRESWRGRPESVSTGAPARL